MSKEYKKEIYKILLNKKIFNPYEINKKPVEYENNYELNLLNLGNVCNDTNLVDDLIFNFLDEEIEDFSESNYVLISLSSVWNYLLGEIQYDDKYVFLLWSLDVITKFRLPSNKFGAKCIVFIDRLNEENVAKLKLVYNLCKKNDLEYKNLVVLFDDETGYKDLVKYNNLELNILSIFKLSLILNYYELENLINEYQLESIRYNKDITYNKNIVKLKNIHRVNNKTFNYQSKHNKYILNNIKLLNFINALFIDKSIIINNLPLLNYIDKSSNLKKSNMEQINLLEKSNKSTHFIENSKKQMQIDNYNYNFNLVNNFSVNMYYCRFIVDLRNMSFNEINNLLNNINNVKCESENKLLMNFKFNVIISVDLLQNIKLKDLIILLNLKNKLHFNLILDIPLLDIFRLKTNLTLSENIINIYNIKHILHYENEDFNNSDNTYKSLVNIIDFVILDLIIENYDKYTDTLHKLNTINAPNLGLILKFSNNSSNSSNSSNKTQNILYSDKIWEDFNIFLNNLELNNNINIVGLINNNYNFGKLDIGKCISLIHELDFTKNLNEQNIETKISKLENYDKLILNYNFTISLLNKLNLCNDNDYLRILNYLFPKNEFKNVIFSNVKNNKTVTDKGKNKDTDSDITDGIKNKDILEDEDDYEIKDIFTNIICKTVIISDNVVYDNVKQIFHNIYDNQINNINTNMYLIWYNSNVKYVSKFTNIKNKLLYYINSMFDFVEPYLTYYLP